MSLRTCSSARLRRLISGLALIAVIMGLTAGCVFEDEPVELIAHRPADSVDFIRIAGSSIVTPIVRKLAESFQQEHPGQVILVDRPLSENGTRRAWAQGALHGALLVGGSDKLAGVVIEVARSEIVLALGPDIEGRTFTAEGVRHAIAGTDSSTLRTFIPSRVQTLRDHLRRKLAAHGGDGYSREPLLSKPSKYGRTLWQTVADSPGAFALADRGNLRLFGLPVWVGTISDLQERWLSLNIVIADDAPARLRAFIAYIRSQDGQAHVSELGFRAAKRAAP